MISREEFRELCRLLPDAAERSASSSDLLLRTSSNLSPRRRLSGGVQRGSVGSATGKRSPLSASASGQSGSSEQAARTPQPCCDCNCSLIVREYDWHIERFMAATTPDNLVDVIRILQFAPVLGTP